MTRPDAPTLFLEFTPTMRTLIEDAIEALILLLDEIDGDAAGVGTAKAVGEWKATDRGARRPP